jgi:hypothetical protein
VSLGATVCPMTERMRISLPEVDRNDAARLILSLSKGTKYLSSYLYERYAEMAREAGRDPGPHNALSRTIHNMGCDRRKMGTGAGARAAWLVTTEAVMNAEVEIGPT